MRVSRMLRRVIISTMKSLKTLVLVAICTVISGHIYADTATAYQWLERFAATGNNVSYDGQFVYLSGTQMKTFRMTRQVDRSNIRERLTQLGGARREWVRIGDHVASLEDGRLIESMNHVMPTHPLLLKDIDFKAALANHYQAVILSIDRVADRNAQRINIIPNDALRFGYHLWFDQQTGLLLKATVVDQFGMPLEKFEFVSLVVGEGVNEKRFESVAVKIDKPQNVVKKPIIVTQNSQVWNPKWVPPGFRLVSDIKQTINQKLLSVPRQVYSDGLFTFTVFFEPVSQAILEQGVFRRGAAIAVSEQVSKQSVKRWVTVVGEIPEKVALRVLRSMNISQSAVNQTP